MLENNEVILIPIISTVLILFLGAVIITGVFLQQKRKLKHQKELIEINARHERLLLQVQLETQEQLFKSISENLHDNIGSHISTAMLLLYKDDRVGTEERELNQNEALRILDRVVDDLKNLARSLNAGYLENIGLREAIFQRLEQVKRSKRYEVDFNFNACDKILDHPKLVMIYYVFQEAISNIGKHAKATRISVDLHFSDEWLSLSIKDNGMGMVPNTRTDGWQAGSGLLNMKRHALLMNAEFNAVADEGKGTEISLKVPFPYKKDIKSKADSNL
jgi:signal transduction histidine kinase